MCVCCLRTQQCADSNASELVPGLLVSGIFAGIGLFLQALFNKALLESLILAQDERWRRA
jgi:hypothetical protein